MVFAVLDGTDVDSGTAAEIGYAFAKGKPILGYRGDFRLSADNDGSIVNLQVEYFIRASGGTIIVLDKPTDKLTDKLGKELANIKPPAR
jgi:nucleoside 2-deoxyribosyltransferase